MARKIALLSELILKFIPQDGSSIGNQALMDLIKHESGLKFTPEEYWSERNDLVNEGLLQVGKGRGGSIMIAASEDDFVLEPPKPKEPKKTTKTASVEKRTKGKQEQAKVISYRHDQKRKNNPHVGMVDTTTDGVEEPKTWKYDPHIDPALQFDVKRAGIEKLIDDALASGNEEVMKDALEQLKRMQEPYLNWTGKAERTSFDVDTVSLHVHERIDPASILAEVQKRMKGKGKGDGSFQPDLYAPAFENLPLREAIDFYKHDRDWANRLIAGDSLLVMNSLLEKEGMAGQVQMIYIDPPYGIKYGSNFQPFVNKRDVRDRKDEDLTQEPEMIKAFRDTWELGIHSYLAYLRDRLLLAKELLHESGSVFVQISDENIHHVRELLDEIMGVQNFINLITFTKTTSSSGEVLSGVADYLLWYAKDRNVMKYHQLVISRSEGEAGTSQYTWMEPIVGSGYRRLDRKQQNDHSLIPDGFKVFAPNPCTSQRPPGPNDLREVRIYGKEYSPRKGVWKTNQDGFDILQKANRLLGIGSTLMYKRYFDDYPAYPIANVWNDVLMTGFSEPKQYVVQTSLKVIKRCLLMTTDPGDLVFDPTCGSGTTATVAEEWGRRWITCDTSRVAIALAKQRLMTVSYDYYELKYPSEGVKGGFIYKTVPHITLKSIANNPEIDDLYERMHPSIEKSLTDLNKALVGKKITFMVDEGGRKGEKLDFSKKDEIMEWEVPFEFPGAWPEEVKKPFKAFQNARQAMQQRMDSSIAAHADHEVLYDQPEVSRSKLRITGPFTVEAVPFPSVLSLDEAKKPEEADVAIARSGETSRQSQWRDELLRTGIRGKGGQKIVLADLDPMPELKYIHAVGTVAETGERVAVSFGPEHAALEQRQVEIAMKEAGQYLFPVPKMLVFCAFTFDPEAAKDIDSIKGITALKAQMNTDLLTADLKKGRASNESFWLMGQPDVEVRKRKDGRYEVEVHGFDYFDTITGELQSGGKKKIAMWALDTDYDDRSLFPKQVFFPIAGSGDGWFRLKKDIRAELNEDLLEQFHGTVSIPFEAGESKRIAVKIIDDRGIESLKVIDLD